MPALVTAEFQDRERILFTARGRAFVNVRRGVEDGPIGFSSTELLLIAIGNCSLGHLLSHPLLQDEELGKVTATFEGEIEREPTRVARIISTFRIEVGNPALLALADELSEIACACPMCNSVTSEKVVTVIPVLTRAPGLV